MKMFGTVESGHGDDEVDSDGRVRTFKHERGNWAGYICIKRNAHHNCYMSVQNVDMY